MSKAGKKGLGEAPPPLIIVKKKGHKGHHGGAWKVAYADFVTTMMALFIVLWAAGQDTTVRESIAAYFRNPAIVPAPVRGAGVLPASTGVVATADLLANEPSPEREQRLLREAAEAITRAIEQAPDLRPLLDQVQISVTEDGLRIQMTERDDSLFFEVGSARVKPAMSRLLGIIAAAVGRIPNDVIVEGHTDARQYGSSRSYTNWELSADRANSARRILEAEGLRPGQIARVVGFAHHDLLVPDPMDPKNRRVSVLVRRRAAARAGAAAALDPGPTRVAAALPPRPGPERQP
jgi:chemotaxis protein MotB